MANCTVSPAIYAGGDSHLAAQMWREAGLPERGMIPVTDLEPVRQTVRERAATR
ncbi:hypothetical protein [Streptomyces violaceusniger]|uniref:hypothetical protein n=1 Tax=Streptomyces violaceusniger TaxID=68280 RepID=UPI00142F3833|nr:hypothetical protein [Streptomyces violaceusniger]